MVKYILRLGRMHEFLNVKVLDTGLPLLCGFHFLTRGEVCSIVIGVEVPDLFPSCDSYP